MQNRISCTIRLCRDVDCPSNLNETLMGPIYFYITIRENNSKILCLICVLKIGVIVIMGRLPTERLIAIVRNAGGSRFHDRPLIDVGQSSYGVVIKPSSDRATVCKATVSRCSWDSVNRSE